MNLKKIISLSTLLLSFSILFAQKYQFEEKNGVRTFNEGSLIIKEDIPFLTVKGNSYEMGLQYGVLMNDLLLDMDHTVDSLIESYIGSFFIKKWIAKMVLGAKIKKVEETVPNEYIRELKGMADGSDLKLKELKIIAYFPQLFFKISCTAFIMKNETGIVHGRNLDWPGIEALTQYPLIVNYHKGDKNPVTVLTFRGYPGVYTGMNHNGLSMSINMNGTPADDGKETNDYNTGMPLAYKLRNILENADEISEVDQMFNGYSSHAWFITVGSKKDKSGAIYELTRGEVIKNEMKSDFLFVENLSLSDKGRYKYSPIWMHGTSNISRERKIEELYKRIYEKDLVSKSYQILTNTENHHLKHDPFFRYCINNSITVKSCIMDNSNNKIYFTYGERLAALNKYLEYDMENHNVSVYKERQDVVDINYLNKRLEYQEWYANEMGNKKKLENEDYRKIINTIDKLDLEPAYKYYLLSFYYSKLENYELAHKKAEKYIEERPDFFLAYYNKYKILNEKGDYIGAIQALEEMLKTSTINPYYEYLAYVSKIKLYDKLLEQNLEQTYIDEIFRLGKKVREDISKYLIDNDTRKDLDVIKTIEEKYRN